LGEIRMFAGTFAPLGWLFCDGQLVSIMDHEALFTVVGTTYGGDGQDTFALPDLRGRVPVHQGPGYLLGERAGVERVTLTSSHLPPHDHAWVASSATATTRSPAGALLSTVPSATVTAYATAPSSGGSYPAALVGAAGGNQPHENMHPFLTLSFIIATYGIFPSMS
ncbi:MAG: phage tail protein, partial [Polyangiaceae bacterium]|nr:phage tail protein [Polyangiaceae bacterium]